MRSVRIRVPDNYADPQAYADDRDVEIVETDITERVSFAIGWNAALEEAARVARADLATSRNKVIRGSGTHADAILHMRKPPEAMDE